MATCRRQCQARQAPWEGGPISKKDTASATGPAATSSARAKQASRRPTLSATGSVNGSPRPGWEQLSDSNAAVEKLGHDASTCIRQRCGAATGDVGGLKNFVLTIVEHFWERSSNALRRHGWHCSCNYNYLLPLICILVAWRRNIQNTSGHPSCRLIRPG